MSIVQRFLGDRKGATAIEYGLIAAILAAAIVAGFTHIGDALQFLFGSNESRLLNALQ